MDLSSKRMFRLQFESSVDSSNDGGVNTQSDNISNDLTDMESLLEEEKYKKIKLDLSDDFQLLNDDIKIEPDDVTIGENDETELSENIEIKDEEYLDLDFDISAMEEEEFMQQEMKEEEIEEEIDEKSVWLKENTIPKGIMDEDVIEHEIMEGEIKEEEIYEKSDWLKENSISKGIIMEENIIEHVIMEGEIKEEEIDEKPVWLEDNTIPKRWKRRIFPGNGISKFNIPSLLSPCGRQFRSRLAALVWMIRNNKSFEELEEMISSLVHEGWELNSLLPEGWKFRINHSATKQTFQFLDKSFKVIKNLKEANEMMRRNYDIEDVDRLKMFMEILSIERRIENYTWDESCTVPEGWKVRIAEGRTGKTFYLSPDGIQFSSRCKGLQHMLKANTSAEAMEEMKNSMIEYEDWEENQNLPKGWLYRETSISKSLYLFTKEGLILESFISAIEYLTLNQYDEEDVTRMEVLMTSKGVKRRLDNYKWVTNEDLPLDWKIRTADGNDKKTYLLEPNGKQFVGRRNALSFMVSNNFAYEEVEKMRKDLEKDGWNDDRLIPKTWKIRRARESNRDVYFLDKTGKKLHGFKAVKDYFVSNRKEFTDEEVNNFDIFCELESIRRTVNSHKWNKQDKTIPEGWMSRINSGFKDRLFFLSPDGVQFNNRRVALQHLIKNGHDEEEIEEMRSFLQHEGWEFHHKLPNLWMYWEAARFSSGITVNCKIVSDDGQLFESFLTAVEFLKSSPMYTSNDVEKIKEFMKEKSNVRRQTLDIWDDEKDLPDGWKSRIVNGCNATKRIFMSPNGTQCYSERKALQQMIKENNDQFQIKKMRFYMKKGDWKKNQNLPEGWMIRGGPISKGSYKNMIISSEGESFHSYLAVVEHMKSSKKYSSKDINLIRLIMDEKVKERHENNEEWKADKTLPTGWRTRIAEGKTVKQFFLSPDGTQFPCRRAALQNMIDSKYKSHEIDKMRSSLLLERWEFNRNLPKNWLYKESAWKNKSGITKGFQILSVEGQIFESFLTTEQFMKFNPEYNDSDIDNIKDFMKEKSNIRRQTMEVWDEDKNLPDGWRSRFMDGKLIRKIYLSPDGIQFIGGRLALVHMIKEKYAKEKVDKLRLAMAGEGWEQSKNLPEGWIIKETSTKNTGGISSNCKIITDDGQVHESYSSAIEAMLYTKRFGADDVSRIRQFMAEKSTLRRQTLENWEDDKNLPNGWRFRIAEGVSGVMLFLAPDGKQFKTRKTAYQHLIKEKYDLTDVEIMKGLLMSHDKWQEDSCLPNGWIFKETNSVTVTKNKSKSSYNFLTTQGDYFEGSTKPMEYIESSTLYSKSDLKKFQQFLPERQSIRRKSNSNEEWEDDKYLPEGWRFKISGNNGNKPGKLYFLAPDGKQSHGRKIAYQHLIRENYSSKDVEIMKSLLIQFEKWQEHPSLPVGWLFKENVANVLDQGKKYGYNYITSEGDCFEGSNGAKDYMKSSTLYSNSDVDGVQKFMKDRRALRQKSNEDWEDDKNLPEGWRFKISGNTDKNAGKLYMLAPDGKQFQGRKVAYQHLIKDNYSLKDVEIMKSLLIQFEKWQDHPKLPVGWIFKENVANDFDQGKKYGYNYITTEGDCFEGTNGVKDYMKSSNLYSNSDLERVQEFIQDRRALRQKSNEDWEDDKNLPEGWRFKISGNTGKNVGKLYYLTPEGKQIQGRKSSLLHLIKGNYEESDVKKMKDILIKYEKWEMNTYLPEGWIFREASNFGNDRGVERKMYSYSFVSREGVCFESASSAIGFVKDSSEYDENDVENMFKLVPERQAARRGNTEGWLEDLSVPDGWKYKVREGKENRKSFLSPQGSVYQNRRSGLQHMISDGYSESDINRMREGLAEEGWVEHDHLPENWKYKITASTHRPGIRILTENGDVFDNFRSARDYFGENDVYNSEEFTYFEKEVSKKLKIKRNLTVPKEWKIDGGNEEEKSSIIAPNGIKFVSRQAAVMSMIAGGYSEHDLDKMKQCLKHEGWKEKSGLPEGWKYKFAKDSDSMVVFLSSEADILESFEEAKDYLMANSVSKEKFLNNVNKLTNFLEENILEPLKEKSFKKSEWIDSETVPAGWKVKKSSPKVMQAPDGTQFQSKKRAIQFMVMKGWRLEDLEAMRSKLSLDGWNLDPRLPTGWAMMLKPKSECIRYITPSGQEVMSTRAAVLHLKENYGTQEDIEKIGSLLKRTYSEFSR